MDEEILSCGQKQEEKETAPPPSAKGRFQDLSGRQFGRLTAVRPTGSRAKDGSYYWLCRCNCGNTSKVSSNKLLQGRTVSCGCYAEEIRRTSRTYIGGTCLEIINSKKLFINNTSGVTGVSANRGKWMVKISFAKKQFFLGRYDDYETAVAVRKAAEDLRSEVADEIDVLQDQALNVFS